MNSIHTLLSDIDNQPHCIIPKYASALKAKLQKHLDDGEPMEMPDTGSMEDEMEIYNGVAVININGVICKRIGLPEVWLEALGLCDLDNVNYKLKAALSDDSVSAVILNVCSPGGFLSGVQSTANLVAELAKKKECVVYSDVLNASAAYWISSQASAIIGSVDAEFGSIGVYTSMVDMSKALDAQGIKVNVIKAGKWKAMGDPTQPLTDEQRAFVQEEINQTWSNFKNAVNSKRSLAEEDMQGQTFSGEQCLDKGLVDGFATCIEEVLEELAVETIPTVSVE